MKVELNSYSSFFYIALTFLVSRRSESLPPEILYLLDPNEVLQFVDMYGGQKIYIPTRKELALDLKATLVAYYKFCEGKTELTIMEEMGISGREMRSIYARIQYYLDYIKKEKLVSPELLRGLTDVKPERQRGN